MVHFIRADKIRVCVCVCNSRAYGHQPCSCRPCRRATTPSSWLWLTQPDSRTPPRSLSLFSQVQCGADTDIFLCFQQLVRLISFFLFHFVAKNNVFPVEEKADCSRSTLSWCKLPTTTSSDFNVYTAVSTLAYLFLCTSNFMLCLVRTFYFYLKHSRQLSFKTWVPRSDDVKLKVGFCVLF